MQHHGRREGAASASPAAAYTERAERFDREAAERLGRVRVYGRLRLALFAAAVAGAWWLFVSGRGGAAWLLLAAAAFLFAVLVARQRAARRRMRRSELMSDFNREGIARVERRWGDLPSVPGATAARDHDYAVDLDLYGDASLLKLLGVCGTAPGWNTLQAWMLGGADADEVTLRQEAVLEMAGALDFRDRLAAEGRLVASGDSGDTDASADRFLRWAEGDAWHRGHRWLRIAGLVLAPVNVAAITLFSLGAVPTPALAWPLVISALVLVPRWQAIHSAFAEADDGESGVRQFGPLLRHIHDASLGSRHAVAIRNRLGAYPRVAHEEMNVLRRLLDMADVRRSPLFHIPLALVLHWDVHVLVALERWKERSGHRVRDWLDATGEAEALAALAALAADHPDWTMPALDPDAHTVEARALGHPLIAPDICVRNDVEVGPAGSFLLVTGSNMSGKSTLLRALGLNAVLAQAGGPVCAARLRMPPLRVVTSMRVDDSLAEGVSYFMAGLQRLKMVVEAARSPGSVTPRTLYLLDEILQGTNSAERRVAARTVLRHLLETDAIGAVTTHDLSLAEAGDLTTRAVAVHLTESVDDGAEGLAFDYRLRPGIATSTNALKLLEMVGLGQDVDLAFDAKSARQ
ncbi:MAG: DNA mismatch repair protein MutS [Gemmatimonadetes bacterium]|nr:DNA mismatch repair protein MutS [Gemmatimonadota bacterium]MXX70716.1 DNA mismatch repair protein MutS [Gemmatimonadota bacterium]MYC90938.1 DNA mismatch repair protein MutS [Gemmatimonadota bacterium]MYG35956.1 DNA mismatch repair protein MutS [Gemmatimonadota bacterium]MYJ17230.1 DNA mismatch repair protein MutS [Gemmatimonadota bacterium]